MLDLIFTEAMYIFIGKTFTVLLLLSILKLIHKQIYKRVYTYSYVFDFLAIPYHYVNIMLCLMPSKAIDFYKVLSNQDKPNFNMRVVRAIVKRRLLLNGYSETEIDNYRIEYSNILLARKEAK